MTEGYTPAGEEECSIPDPPTIEGDTLWKIAELSYGDPRVWPAISRENNLPRSNLILVGMQLRLPIIPQQNIPEASSNLPRGMSSSPTSAVMGSSKVVNASYLVPREAVVVAKPISYPALQYDLDKLPGISIPTEEMEITLRYAGDIVLKKNGIIPESEFRSGNVFSVTQTGNLSLAYQNEYSSKFNQLAGSIRVLPDLKARTLQVSCGFSAAAKVNGHVFATTECKFTPPDRYSFTYKPQPIKGEYQGFTFEGSIGYEVEVRQKPRHETQSAMNPAIKWIEAGALLTAGAAVIIVDGLKDEATLGFGVAETPLSWSFAMTLFQKAGAAIH